MSRKEPKEKRLPQLGELELAVLDHLWKVGETDVIDTHATIGKPRGITRNTVGSALERLHRKSLVRREKISHAYRYQATMSQDEFRRQMLIDAAGGLKELASVGLLTAFVDAVADIDTEALDQLEMLIHLKRKEHNP